jgi:O-antigen ligase
MRHALPNFPINEAHNGYLEVYLNLGWAGICLVAVLLMTAYKRVSIGIRLDPVNGSMFLGFFLCTLFYSFTEAGFRLMSPSWFFLLLVIVASAQITIARSRVPIAVSRRGGREAEQEIENLVASRSPLLAGAPDHELSNPSVADLSSLISNK